MKSYRAPASFQRGRYIPNKVLGTGTYGQVIQCHDTVTGEEVAVKVAQSDAAYRRSALNEITALLSLNENNDSVGILDSFEDGGHVCIVSELLDRNLFEVLRHRGFSPLSLPEVRQVALHVLRALASLHQSGYIHCDIKPENIMLRRSASATIKSSSVQGSSGIDNNNSGSLKKSGEHNTYPSALVGGQQTLKLDIIANTHNQLWRSTNSNHSFALNTHNTSSLDGDMNTVFSPRVGNSVCGCSQVHHGQSSSGDTTAAIGGSLDAFFGMPAAGVGINGAGNTIREDRKMSNNKSGDSQEQSLHSPRSNPYSRTCLIDFGAVRRFSENTYYDVQSLWYRAPEVLCGLPYTTAIDSWSVGCVLFELFTGKPLFPGESVERQLSLIVQHVGYPSKAALTMGCLAAQFHLPMSYVLPSARREHMRQLIFSSREAGLQRWRKYQMQKHQEAHVAVNQPQWTPSTTEVSSPRDEDDAVLNATPYGVSGVEASAEDLDLFVDFISDLLHPDESQRIHCAQALHHAFLKDSPRCGNTTPFPGSISSTASFPPVTAAPAPMPCIVATNSTGRPVMMTASPVSVPLGCSVSPFVVHPVHPAPAAAMPFTMAPVGSMMGVEVKLSPLSVPSQHQPTQAFSTYPALATSTVYATNSSGQVLQCSVPVFTQMGHRVPPNLGPTFLPFGMTAQGAVGGAYCPTSETVQSLPQHTLPDVNISPTFSPTGPLVHTTVSLGFTSNATSDGSTAAIIHPDQSLQSRHTSSYMLTGTGTIPCIREYEPDLLSSGMPPCVLCHVRPHQACATVMSP